MEGDIISLIAGSSLWAIVAVAWHVWAHLFKVSFQIKASLPNLQIRFEFFLGRYLGLLSVAQVCSRQYFIKTSICSNQVVYRINGLYPL